MIAVDVLGRPPASSPAATSLAAAMRADQIARAALEREHLAKADLVVSPEVEAIDWADFSQPESRIAEGERAALGKLKQIREMLSDFEGRFVRGSFAVRACRPEVGAVPAGSAP